MNSLEKVTEIDIKKLYISPANSHKGQNGRLLIIGGSHLFHAASIWSLQVASRIVDLVHYCSIEENNELITRLKSEFRNGIVVERKNVEEYIKEDDCVLIGPGMVRPDRMENSKSNPLTGGQTPINYQIQSINDLNEIADEGLYTELLTNYLLAKYPQKRWVIDAGALQTVDLEVIPKNSILTPHQGELEILFNKIQNPITKSKINSNNQNHNNNSDNKLVNKVKELSQELNCTVLLKGQIDIACNHNECRIIEGGNAGMTKGGTGDVLAGLIAALACKNDSYLATIAGSFINKKAGDELFEKVGLYFNSTDLANQIPSTMKRYLF